LTPDLQERFFSQTDAQLVNLYGPTEACIDATFWICQRTGHGPSIPIGRPINQVQTYLLDHHLNPVPIGVAGELHIGGRCLARGYLKRPELTGAKFIPCPFNPQPGAKLYKTGDLGRYLADGNIEYLGRFDHQVKIRGYRIELGEIEASLSRHPAVKSCVVVARQDESDDHRLVAYIAASPGRILAMAELGRFLKKNLPDHLVPSAFVVLDALPLMPNGKVDRQRLPAPTRTDTVIDAGYVAPEGPVQEMLVDVWQAVLGLAHIGVHDNFFQLGGHSLLGTRMISRLHREYDIDLPLRTLFERPTIAALADLIEEKLIEELDHDQLAILKEEE
jgi:acyl-CoA synthetase (AMP-forming)/AMP-acid ligase II/acyl carrier protein